MTYFGKQSALAILKLAIVLMVAQVHAQEAPFLPPAPPAAEAQPARAPERTTPRRWRQWLTNRDPMSSPVLQLRRLLNEEFANLPTLREKLSELLELQQEHLTLQRLRERIARGTGQPTDEQLRQFHELLAREEALSSRSAALVKSFQRDRAKLLDEIAARRQVIENKLDELRNKAPSEPSPKQSEELRNLYRARRVYAHLAERLKQLDETGSAMDWQNRLLRGLWSPEEVDPRVVEQARERLRQLEHEQQELRERLDDLREQLEDLREILSAAGPPSTLPKEPREQAGFERPRTQQPPQPGQQRARRQGVLPGPQPPQPPELDLPPRNPTRDGRYPEPQTDRP